MRKILHFAMALFASLSAAACSQGSEGDSPAALRIGMVPDAGATAASVTEKQPLQAYLSQAIGGEVELVIPTNYNATVEALGNGSLDIAYLGGLTFVKARERYGAEPLVQRGIDRQFHSVFVTRPDTGIGGMEELRGRSFCFGDVNSTSGHLMPRFALRQAGLSDALGDTRNTGSHPATAQAVAGGACDAGAMDETVYRQLLEDGQLDESELGVFFTSEPFADYVWAARADLPQEAAQAFADAMLTLKRGQDDEVLDILRGDEFVPAEAASYSDVESTARDLGLL